MASSSTDLDGGLNRLLEITRVFTRDSFDATNPMIDSFTKVAAFISPISSSGPIATILDYKRRSSLLLNSSLLLEFLDSEEVCVLLQSMPTQPQNECREFSADSSSVPF